jgi:AraC-like DNA-binding protein
LLLNEIIPNPLLAGFVRLYRIIHFVFPKNITIPPKAYTPRPEQCLQFFPVGSNEISYAGKTGSSITRNAAIIGQHTIINHRQPENDFLSIQVIFQPGALQRWLGMSAYAMTNTFLDAEDIIGKELVLVNEQLYHAEGYEQMIRLIEQYLFGKIKQLKKYNHPVNTIAGLMLKEEGRPLDWYVKEACLSHRQFDRKFYESTGVGPKEFMKLIRFDKAFRMKNRFPGKDWLSIALHCGYYDYPHLSKAYKDFTGYTPETFFKIDNKAPERLFGEAET